MSKITFEEVLAVMRRYPNHVFVEIGMETNPEDNGRFLFVSLHERPPEEGWTSQGAMFRSAKGAVHWRLPVHPADKHANAVRVSVTSRDEAACAKLAYGMLCDNVDRYNIYPPTEETATDIK